jgi:SHS2 domain-containing protein
MPWEVLDHTADAGVVVTAGSREALFAEALRALTDCITVLERVRPRLSRAVALESADAESLLVGWLGEALYRFEVEGFLAASARLTIVDREDGGLRLTGKMLGEIHDPVRHPHKVAVKAITYHGLGVAPAGAGWQARVIFDI